MASFRRALVGVVLALAIAAPARADVSVDQANLLSAVAVPVLVPGPGQPFADEVPTTVTAEAGGYRVEYGTAPTFTISGSPNDNRLLTSPYVCGDDSIPYCTDVALTTADGEEVGDEVFRGLSVGDAPATAEHFTCCNGRGWQVEWSSSGAYYGLRWKSFQPDAASFDPGNVQFAQALADIAAQLVPLGVPQAAAPAPAVSAPPAPPSNPQPAPAPAVQAVAAGSLCGAPANPWGYNFCDNGTPVRSPNSQLCAYFQCIPSFWKQANGYVAQCKDGLLSHSGGVSGACSGHKGEAQPLYGP